MLRQASRRSRRSICLLAVLSAAGPLAAGSARAAEPACAPDGAGLEVAEGFCAALFADGLGRVRNLVVAGNGDVFAALRDTDAGVVALRDADGDGRAELRHRFGPGGGHGVALTGTHLYLSAEEQVVRWPWPPGRLQPDAAAEIVVDGFPAQREHRAKGLALGPDGALFVSIGAPSNSCQRENRASRSPGRDPCPELAAHAGIWRFDAGAAGQRPTPERRFATGMRHTLALAVHPATGALWALPNGRDLLGGNWDYSDERNAELPAEELAQVREGDDLGWPYCYYDGPAGRKVLAPEYGGDGERVGRCADTRAPALALPAHWAPMALHFVGAETPGLGPGALVAFRGSWNRAPLPQQGYRVSFLPFASGRPTGEVRSFARGAGSPTSQRMTGVALGPQGDVFVASESSGSIWRVRRRQP